ncbi:MAG TPA: SDR family oxidoreductase [Treponemataceae bacterium]|mgnify:FL=1|nr:SDR family oxidoreductase [Treponemataceae bacterium]
MDKIEYALITGASAGVGKEMAYMLAKKQKNLVLVARSERVLQSMQKELQDSYGISVLVFAIDLSKEGAAQRLFSFCQEKMFVSLLINNAGVGAFGESVALGNSVLPMLYLNILSLTELCAFFGKEMKERGRGSILNIGSIAGNQPTSFFASYAASKSYVLNYSLALRHELRPFGVNVTCAQPGYIRTGFDDTCNIKSEKYKRFSYKNGMSAKNVAKKALAAVFRKRSFVRIGFTNKIVAFVSTFIPRNLLAFLMSKSIRSMTK